MTSTSVAAPATWTVTGEAGAEVDSNVQRVETGPGLDTCPVQSPVLRFGARVEGRAKAAGGSYVLALSDLTRVVAGSNQPADTCMTPSGVAASVSAENVTVLGGDLKWLHPIGERPVLLGFGITGADAEPMSDPIGDRTFTNIGADALLVARDGDEHRLLVALGARAFTYKPDHQFDWSGATASARLDLVLWQPPSRTRSLELAATVGVEARAYDSSAVTNACPPDAPPDTTCLAGTDLARRDRFQRAGVELTYAGHRVLSVGYQLVVIDSNSFGESLVRHRATASATTGLPWGLYGTLLGILEIDQYLDGLLVRTDLVRSDFANVEDENRSSLQARLAKKLDSGWSVEARAAIWRNLGPGSSELAFKRDLVYLGVVYSR